MPTAEQAELQNRLRTLSQRVEELSALPTSAGHSEEFVSLFQEKRRLEAELHAAPNLTSKIGLWINLPQRPYALAMNPTPF